MRAPLRRGAAVAALAFLGWVISARAAQGATRPLVLYAAMGYDHAVVRAFEQATHVPVRLVHLSTGPLLARVEAERQNPRWDLVWFDGNEGMQDLAEQRMLRCGWTPAPPFNAVGKRLVPRGACYVPTGVTLAGVIAVNTALVAPPARPASWAALAGPPLRDAVGMNNPAISGPTYPFVAGVMQAMGGEAAGKSYFSSLKANGLRVYPTNGATLRALAYGRIRVAVVQSSAAAGFSRRDPQIAVVYPRPVALLPSDVAISARCGGSALNEARQFVRFVLSPEGQRAMQTGDPMGDSNYYPVVASTRPLAGLPPLGALGLQVLPAKLWGGREAAIDAWFTSAVVQ
ncbi:MAG TPA: extracellular solute-binding protein [Candidatus Dormibacteraeota bacterium]|nr:extracellular solute-binding protein [Candidatus Dormibacteraeota bacterium]